MAIQSIFVECLGKNTQSWTSFAVTQRILIGSLIGEQEVKPHAKLNLLHIYHIVIQSELKRLIGAKVPSLQTCETSQRTAGSVRFGLSMRLNPLQWFQFGFNPHPEQNHRFGTVANTPNVYITKQLFKLLIRQKHSNQPVSI